MSTAPVEFDSPVVELGVRGLLTPGTVSALSALNSDSPPQETIETTVDAYRRYAIKAAAPDLVAVTLLDPPSIRSVLDKAWMMFSPTFARAMMPTIAAAYFKAFTDVHEGSVPAHLIYDLAQEHAQRIGQYFHETSTDALVEGFNGLLNRQVPQKAAIERALQGFGLSPRQMRGYVAAVEIQPKKVSSALDLNFRGRIIGYIEKSVRDRLKIFKEQETHNLEQQANQVAWLWLKKNDKLPVGIQKQWQTAKDEKVCAQCGPLHGKKIGIDERFQLPNGSLLYTPGAHVNCRCRVRLTMPLEVVEKADNDFDPVEHPRGTRGRFVRRGPQHNLPVAEREALPELEEMQRRLTEQREAELEAPMGTPLLDRPIETEQRILDTPLSRKLLSTSLNKPLLEQKQKETKLLGEDKKIYEPDISTVLLPQPTQLTQRQEEQLGLDFTSLLNRIEERYGVQYKHGLITARIKDAVPFRDHNGVHHRVFVLPDPANIFYRSDKFSTNGTVNVEPIDEFHDWDNDVSSFNLATGNGRLLNEAFEHHIERVADQVMENQISYRLEYIHPDHGQMHTYLSRRDVSQILRQVASDRGDEIMHSLWLDTDNELINEEFEGDPIRLSYDRIVEDMPVDKDQLALPVVITDHGYESTMEYQDGVWSSDGQYEIVIPPHREDILLWDEGQGSHGRADTVPVKVYRVEPSDRTMGSTTRELTGEEAEQSRNLRYVRRYGRNRPNG